MGVNTTCFFLLSNFYDFWQILHSQEGPIHAAKWRASLIAWANDVGVKIYDTGSNQRLTYIERPRGSPRAELMRPHLVWQVWLNQV